MTTDPYDLLRANLRRAGYKLIARNLRQRVADLGGVPCTIREGLDVVSIHHGTMGSGLRASDMKADRQVASETWHARKRRDKTTQLPIYPGGPMRNVTIRIPADLRHRIEKLRHGETFAAAVRDILERYAHAAEGR